MKGYKGFDQNLRCRGFQYKVGETAEEDLFPHCGSMGLHFCDDPRKVFIYYTPANLSRFAEVDAIGTIDSNWEDGLHCTSELKVKKEIKLEDFYRLLCKNKGIHVLNKTAISDERFSITEHDNNGAICIAKKDYSMSKSTRFRSSALTCDIYSYALTTESYSMSTTMEMESVAEAHGNCSMAIAQNANSAAIVDGVMSMAIALQDYSIVKVSSGSIGVITSDSESVFIGELGAVIVVLIQNDGTDKFIDAEKYVVDGVNVLPNHFYEYRNGELVDRGIFSNEEEERLKVNKEEQ